MGVSLKVDSSEYIKREDALDKFKRMPPSPTKDFIIETLNAIPAADVEPVVRGELRIAESEAARALAATEPKGGLDGK